MWTWALLSGSSRVIFLDSVHRHFQAPNLVKEDQCCMTLFGGQVGRLGGFVTRFPPSPRELPDKGG